MEKYIILCVLSLTINGLRGQVSLFDISGPTVIENVKSFNGKGTSVVSIINDNKNVGYHSVDSAESRRPVFSGKPSAAVGDSPVYKDLQDDEISFSSDENDDYEDYAIINQFKGNKVYKSDHRPLVIHGTGPAGVSIQNVRSVGDGRSPVVITNVRGDVGRRNYYPREGPARNYVRY